MRHTAMAKRHFQTGNDWNRLQLFWEQAALQRLLSLALNCRIGAVGKEQAVVAAESGRSNVGGKRTGAARRDRSA